MKPSVRKPHFEATTCDFDGRAIAISHHTVEITTGGYGGVPTATQTRLACTYALNKLSGDQLNDALAYLVGQLGEQADAPLPEEPLVKHRRPAKVAQRRVPDDFTF